MQASETDTSRIGLGGTPYVTRVVPVPQTISPEAQKVLARVVLDSNVPQTLEQRRSGTDKWQARPHRRPPDGRDAGDRHLSHKSVSKLAGVAPLASDSGKHQGIAGCGEAARRCARILFVVASAVARYEPDFMAFRKRLLDAGKPPKVIRIAVAHKFAGPPQRQGARPERPNQPKPSPRPRYPCICIKTSSHLYNNPLAVAAGVVEERKTALPFSSLP